MKTFIDHISADDRQELDEASFLRSVSALVLFKRILSRSTSVQQSTDTNEMLKLVASQNTNLAAMIYAMTQLLPNNRKSLKK